MNQQGPRFPFVIWMGRNPIEKNCKRLFRLIWCGPPRENRSDDAPFAVEQRIGRSHMRRTNWGRPDRQGGGEQEAMWALGHVLGCVLMTDPAKLVAGHPIHCELNMAVIEGRETKGCDCNRPAEPAENDATP